MSAPETYEEAYQSFLKTRRFSIELSKLGSADVVYADEASRNAFIPPPPWKKQHPGRSYFDGGLPKLQDEAPGRTPPIKKVRYISPVTFTVEHEPGKDLVRALGDLADVAWRVENITLEGFSEPEGKGLWMVKDRVAKRSAWILLGASGSKHDVKKIRSCTLLELAARSLRLFDPESQIFNSLPPTLRFEAASSLLPGPATDFEEWLGEDGVLYGVGMYFGEQCYGGEWTYPIVWKDGEEQAVPERFFVGTEEWASLRSWFHEGYLEELRERNERLRLPPKMRRRRSLCQDDISF